MLTKFAENSRNFISNPKIFFLAALAATLFSSGCFDRAAPENPVTAGNMADAEALRDTLQFLNLARAEKLNAVPAGLDKFPKLTQLSLRDQKQITALPDEIAALKNLEYLDIANTGIRQFAEIGSLQNIKTLYASDNALETLPQEIGALQNLTYLNLERNQLTALPDEIGNLANLKWLRLHNNRLTALPDSATGWKNIRRLYLRDNKFTEFPAAILQMESLEELDLGGNQITVIPDEIVALKNLKRIDLDNNPVTALPENIGDMQNLTHLILNGTKLPETERTRIRAAFPHKVKTHIAF